MATATTIDPTTERAVRAFIAKVVASLNLVSAILFGDSGGDAP